MKLWTLIVDYDGGTFLEQASAPTLRDAVEKICDITSHSFLKSLLGSDLDDPSPIVGIEGSWCISGLYDDKLVLAHVVQTCNC